MAVAGRGAALSALRTLIGRERVPAATLLHRPYLPEGIEPAEDEVRLTPETLIGGYGDEARYALAADRLTRIALAGPPAAVLAGAPRIAGRLVRDYVGASIDLTMQGGTTSGVVYPLAVCDLATAFRFRNVGGASAGAIAAALTAAAELGRSEGLRSGLPGDRSDPDTGSDSDTDTGSDSDTAPTPGTVRRGFVGLTDIVGWLTQIRSGDPERDEFRLAQLFRAPDRTKDLFRLLVAAARQRTWSLPVVAWSAFGWPTWLIAYLIMAGTVVGTGWVAGRFLGRDAPWYATLGWGLLGYAGFLATAFGIVFLVHGSLVLRRVRRRDAPGPTWVARLGLVSSRNDDPPVPPLRLLGLGVALGMAGLLVLVFQPAPYWSGWLVGLSGTLSLLAVMLVAAALVLRRFRTVSYGLLAGSSPQRRRNLVDLMAGVPRPTVTESVLPWLAGNLNRLAGLPEEEVLRFGHLWAGTGYSSRRLDPARTPEFRALAEDVDRRLVNLELMTTDVTRQRPYRFPLSEVARADPERLWLEVDALRGSDGSAIVDDRILAALAEGTPRRVADLAGVVHTLHPLPDPWELPVLFAVASAWPCPGCSRRCGCTGSCRPPWSTTTSAAG